MCIKQNVFWMAAMAATFSMASCSLEEIVDQPTQQAIGFSSFVGKPTKAVTQTDLDFLKGSNGGFRVWGGYSATNIFEGRKVTWSSGDPGSWGYTGTEYWVPNQKYQFAAVGPAAVFGAEESVAASTLETTPTGSNPTFTYNSGETYGHLSFTYSQSDLTKSEDVVYAEATKSTNNMLSTDPDAVSLTFGHIMSWIKIKFVHKMTNGYKITVSDVTVDGVKTGAKFTGSGVSTGGWTWDTSTTNATFNNQTPHSYKTTDGSSDGSANGLLDTDGDNCMVDFIAIPQTITYSADGTPSGFTISFKLQVQDSQYSYLLGSVDGGVDFSTTLTDTQTWDVNNVYVYTANLTADVIGLKPIEFEASVSPWPTDGGNYHEPEFTPGR